MSDLIDRQAAIDAIRDNESESYITINNLIDKDVAVALINNLPSAQPEQTASNYLQSLPTSPLLVGKMPSAQPEQSDTSEFWRKRADFYSDMCMNLIGEMGRGVEIESVKINENGIEFIKKQPPAQSIDLQELEDRFGEYVRFVVNDMLTGEGKRWTR